MTDDAEQTTGRRLKERRLELGLNVSQLMRESGIHRDTITKIEKGGGDGSYDTTITTLDRTLARLEETTGVDPADSEHSGVVRFVVRGVYGAESLVVEGPVENIAELERSVDRIMRRHGPPGDQSNG